MFKWKTENFSLKLEAEFQVKNALQKITELQGILKPFPIAWELW